MPSHNTSISDDDPWVGRDVSGKYRIVRLLGRGGMGSVYEAENTSIGKRVALKLVDFDPDDPPSSVRRFEREARAAGAIESPHVVQVFDTGKLEDGRPYLVMELLRGENLGQRLRRTGRLAVQDTVLMASQVLLGLRSAHDSGVIHRDLKPDNIFLVETDRDVMLVKIVDFGISKAIRDMRVLGADTITQQGVVMGTPAYMAPEQAQTPADLDARADLWSVGAIMYECLTGQKPFVGASYEQVIVAICTTAAPSLRGNPDIPGPLADIVEKALTRDRDHRFASAEHFHDALQTFAASQGYPSPSDLVVRSAPRHFVLPAGATSASNRWASFRLSAPSLYAIGILVVAVVGTLWVLAPDPPESGRATRPSASSSATQPHLHGVVEAPDNHPAHQTNALPKVDSAEAQSAGPSCAASSSRPMVRSSRTPLASTSSATPVRAPVDRLTGLGLATELPAPAASQW